MKKYLSPDGRTIFYVATQIENGIFWQSAPYEPTVSLTIEEEQKAKSMNWDLEKVLLVKKLLKAKKTPTQIQKETGISRNSINKYRKILSLKDTRVQDKDNESTGKSENVLCNQLIFILFINESTSPLFVIIAPILLLAVVGYFKVEYDKFTQQMREHKEVAKKLHLDFVGAMDLSYERYPILVISEKEKIRFEMLLKHYNNQGREIFLVIQGYGQDNNAHYDERNKIASDYTKANAKMIDEADKRSKEVWKNLDQIGYLDYLKTPPGPQWEKSKEYLEAKTAFYKKHKHNADVTDKARKKFIIEDVEIES